MSNRKHSNLHYVRSVLGQVWRHPSNRRSRVRACSRAVGWQVRKRLSGSPVEIPYGPYRVRCYADTGSAANVIYFTERFDPVEQAFMDAYLRPGDHVVDVGANVGLYALWAAALTAPDGVVHAFEAAPGTVARLSENVALNGLEERIEVHPTAVSDSVGEVEFFVDFDVSNGIATSTSDRSRSRTAVVPAVDLDSSLGTVDFALAKIDVEGAELAALNGWAQSLRRGSPPVLLIELLEGQLQRQDTSVAEVVELLGQLGFALYQFDPDDSRLMAVDVADVSGGNAIAVWQSALDGVQSRLASSAP